jgi:hypothetical protein
MQLKQVVEVVWRFYQDGRASATNQNLRKGDIFQMCLMEVGYQMKMRFYESRKAGEGEKTDFEAGMLGVREYQLGEKSYQGKRSAIYKEQVLRLPKNADVTNVYMVASNCTGDVNGLLTQLQPGEENFHINDPDSSFPFFVQKGNAIDTYNIPPCVDKIEVERIYTDENLDIPDDIAYQVANTILQISLKVKGVITPTTDNTQDGNDNQLRYQLEKQEQSKV